MLPRLRWVRCGQEKRPVLAAEKKSLGEIAKELSAMWGVDAKVLLITGHRARPAGPDQTIVTLW